MLTAPFQVLGIQAHPERKEAGLHGVSLPLQEKWMGGGSEPRALLEWPSLRGGRSRLILELGFLMACGPFVGVSASDFAGSKQIVSTWVQHVLCRLSSLKDFRGQVASEDSVVICIYFRTQFLQG